VKLVLCELMKRSIKNTRKVMSRQTDSLGQTNRRKDGQTDGRTEKKKGLIIL